MECAYLQDKAIGRECAGGWECGGLHRAARPLCLLLSEVWMMLGFFRVTSGSNGTRDPQTVRSISAWMERDRLGRLALNDATGQRGGLYNRVQILHRSLPLLSATLLSSSYLSLPPMSEYDYSPEAYKSYMATQSRIKDWTHETSRSRPCHLNTPPTPAPRSKSLPRQKRSAYPTEPVPPLPHHGQMQAAGPPFPSYEVHHATKVKHRPPPLTLNLAHNTLQTLEVPARNLEPFARNPHPVPEALALPDHVQRKRAKSSNSARRNIHGGAAMPALPPGAAAPLPPSNGAYMNGMYSGPPPEHTFLTHPTEPAPALPILAAYGLNQDVRGRSDLHRAPAVHGPTSTTRKAKSSATLKARYYQQAQESMPVPPLPMQHQQYIQPHPNPPALYAQPRAAHSSAMLYGAPPGSTAHRAQQARPPIPDFVSPAQYQAPNGTASQMLANHTYTYTYPPHAEERVKSQSLFKRMFRR
ncbi:hypothetical protein FB45DRAFT_1094005 [Roridomyces roridus]|uniref:Uncharacterized protein n=1 Tax=Roridomyces roridus TaxID=1738132 RepID=A0AAD7BG94_9AGAR|nr:hypothetical protein FB45DRAFT_1094005 [Roridomyces roridus]